VSATLIEDAIFPILDTLTLIAAIDSTGFKAQAS
jgi:hypothetical protein